MGGSYRSRVKVALDGDVSFTLPDPSLAGTFLNTGGHVDIKLPDQAQFGISYSGFDRLLLEAGVRWEGWSYYDRLDISFDRPVAGYYLEGME